MKKVTAKAPVNIALIKYWGKADEEKVIPYNSSISISLDNLYTITTIEESDEGFEFFLNDTLASEVDSNKVFKFLKNFAKDKDLEKVRVISKNYVPTAAGLASSASAFAALSLAANSFFETNYDFDKLCAVTRLGSGSACRSLLGGFVAWETNGKVYSLESKYKDFVIISVIIDSNKKEISSRDAMRISVATSPMYNNYVEDSKVDFENFKKALEENDLKQIGELTRKSFVMLHTVMAVSTPSIVYMKDKSIDVLSLVQELESQGIYAYPTMDAGANVKILTTESDYEKIISKLEENGFKEYFVSRLGEGAKVISG